MADGFDRFDQDLRQEGGSGSSFVMGLLTGTVLGAGLGMLFAPKAGAELRSKLSEQAGTAANTASEGYRRASEQAGQWAERGREIYSKASDAVAKGAEEAQKAVAKGAEEAQKYVRETKGAFKPSSSSSGSEQPGFGANAPGSDSTYGSGTYGGSSESFRGSEGNSGSSGAGGFRRS